MTIQRTVVTPTAPRGGRGRGRGGAGPSPGSQGGERHGFSGRDASRGSDGGSPGRDSSYHGGPGDDPSGSSLDKKFCTYCKKPNHTEDECFIMDPSRRPYHKLKPSEKRAYRESLREEGRDRGSAASSRSRERRDGSPRPRHSDRDTSRGSEGRSPLGSELPQPLPTSPEREELPSTEERRQKWKQETKVGVFYKPTKNNETNSQ